MLGQQTAGFSLQYEGYTLLIDPYVSRPKLSPRIVIPRHFDNFFTDIQDPIKFIMNVNIGGFVEEVEKVSKEFEVRTLNLFQKI